ncbi:hypothetical protein TWF730_006408 [Orbilia blumenaviensis]|uniref:Nucleoside phosphorylase domain-containing protein n=1 Tax=Orbilia blumenaviensis TaxID=1796055 RepID=A0AAV9VE80_9PEZI
MGGLMVVLVRTPKVGREGATKVSSMLLKKFTEIKLALVVGVCGGVPSYTHGQEGKQEIICGDVIISDMIVAYKEGLRRRDSIEEPKAPERQSTEIRTLLSKLRIDPQEQNFLERAFHFFEEIRLSARAKYPGAEKDILFEPHKPMESQTDTYSFSGEGSTESLLSNGPRPTPCKGQGCDGKKIERERLKLSSNVRQPRPMIHVGNIASVNAVVKSAEDRDISAQERDIIAFEMEGAGVWDVLHCPCVVIKGVSDYADKHKNKIFQPYAAATAAACARAFLEAWQKLRTCPPRVADNRNVGSNINQKYNIPQRCGPKSTTSQRWTSNSFIKDVPTPWIPV